MYNIIYISKDIIYIYIYIYMTYIYIYVYMIHVYIKRNTHNFLENANMSLLFRSFFNLYIHIYILYIYTYIYVCVCVFFCPYISSHTFKVAIYLYVYKLTK